MPKHQLKTKKGFTIIEVVLVLAVAGLIFLMVFIAFPALQRAQHDTQRTDDMARVQSKLIDWQSNHSNNLPAKSEFNASDSANIKQEDGSFVVESSTCNSNKACQFVRDYMNAAATSASGNMDTFKDPSGEYYNIVITENVSGSSFTGTPSGSITNAVTGVTQKLTGDISSGVDIDGTIDGYTMFIIPGATCKEDQAVKSTKNNFAVLYRMEGSGQKCTNNGS